MNTKWDKHDSQLKQIWQAITLAYGEAPWHVSPVQMLESFHAVSSCTKHSFSMLRLCFKGVFSTFSFPLQKEGRQGAVTASQRRTKCWCRLQATGMSSLEVKYVACVHTVIVSSMTVSYRKKGGEMKYFLWLIPILAHWENTVERMRQTPKGEALGPGLPWLMSSSILPKALELHRA